MTTELHRYHKNTRVPGHTLIGEGVAHRDDGTPFAGASWRGAAGEGRGKCSCGALSEVLPSGYARKQWHRQHKDTVAREVLMTVKKLNGDETSRG